MATTDWSDLTLAQAISSYQERHPAEWRAYVQSESERGFISNSMHDHIISHLEELLPGLQRRDYRDGAVAFRFASERALHFSMWQPENRSRRFHDYWAYVREVAPQLGGVRSNGSVDWSAEQIAQLIVHLQEKQPQFWTNMRDVYDKLGFSDSRMSLELRNQVAARFPVPEDIDYFFNAWRAVVAEANRLYQFEMMKPENKELSERLWHARRDDPAALTFDEWRDTVIAERPGLDALSFVTDRRRLLVDSVERMAAEYAPYQDDVDELMSDDVPPGEATCLGALVEMTRHCLPAGGQGVSTDADTVDTLAMSANEQAALALTQYGLMEPVTGTLARWTPAGKRFLAERITYWRHRNDAAEAHDLLPDLAQKTYVIRMPVPQSRFEATFIDWTNQIAVALSIVALAYLVFLARLDLLGNP
ncbi:hypothetical protein [Bradyrhizobium viridifuturi]|uniref:hypothetical protein n=1 Tax=Bradyrhizobium viridifuturi TaxID=1654716 RepID=UPI00067F38E2|nr:hypothetical protein [Bradyrhizobium viridifuturi]